MATHSNHTKFKIAIFGEVLADIFPDATILGGAPYNVARHLRAFQQHPVLISRVGDDQLKEALFAELTKLDIDQSGLQIDSVYPTGQVTVHLESGNHRFEIEPNQAYDHIHAGMARLTTLATQPDFAYFGTLAQRGIASRLALDAFLDGAQCPRFLDVNLRAPWYNKHMIRRSLLRTEIVKMNEEELKVVCNLFDSNQKNDKDCAYFLIKKFNLKLVLITCGATGAWAVSDRAEETYFKAPQINTRLVDTVGAGDAFAAICILGLLHNWSLQDILDRAGRFATAICTIRGTAPKESDFYLPYIQEWF